MPIRSDTLDSFDYDEDGNETYEASGVPYHEGLVDNWEEEDYDDPMWDTDPEDWDE